MKYYPIDPYEWMGMVTWGYSIICYLICESIERLELRILRFGFCVYSLSNGIYIGYSELDDLFLFNTRLLFSHETVSSNY